MKVHERFFLLQRHQVEFDNLMNLFIKDKDITYTELLIVLNQYTGNSVLKYMLREERHPDDPEKRAGEA